MKILLSIFLSACGLVAAAQDTDSRPILYEISKPGSSETSYLFGTMHVSDSAVTRVLEEVFPYVSKCNVFSGELDLTDVEMDMTLTGTMFLQDTTLQGLYSEEEYQQVQTFVIDKLGPAGSMAMMMKPMWISMSIVQQEMVVDPAEVIDMRLQLKAEEQQLAIEPLETMAEQVKAINDIPLADQAQALLEFALDYDKQMSMSEDLTEKYIEGDLEGMFAIYNSERFSDQIELSLINHRNQVMYDRLSVKLKEGKKVFCAVGALHLPGEQGLIQLLSENGFSVTLK